jgi:hypothetical protein
MKSNFRIIVIALVIIISGQSCSPLISGIYGIKKPKKVNNKTIIDYSVKFNIPLTGSYVLDNKYKDFLSKFDTAKFKEQIKNHFQPLQVLYYDNKGELKTFLINCYAGGFPNLKWNRNGTMKKFPPKKQAPTDNIMPLDSLLNFLKPLKTTKNIIDFEPAFTVVVFWNVFMNRQSKRLIRLVQKNINREADVKVRTIYVNNDNLFASGNQ